MTVPGLPASALPDPLPRGRFGPPPPPPPPVAWPHPPAPVPPPRRAVLTVVQPSSWMAALNTDPPPGVPLIQQQPDGSYVVFPLSRFGFGITSSSGDESQINAALLQSIPQGAPVRLAPYPFLTQSPVALQPSANGASVLTGTCPVVGEAAGSSGFGIFGAVITPQSTWQNLGIPNAGAVYLAPTVPNGGTKMFGPVIRELWIDLRSAAAGTHGLSAYGQVNHGVVTGVGIWGNSTDTTADAIRLDQDAGVEGNNQPDGWVFDTCMVQAYGRYGCFLRCNDATFLGVHVQAAPASTTDSGCYYCAKTNNTRFIGCRADQGTFGWVMDSNPGGTPNAPGASVILDGCGTENIYHNALLLLNSSTTGQQSRTPVLVTGCSFDFAGRDGTSGTIEVDGWNVLTVWNTNMTTAGNNYPQVGLTTKSVGTGPGVPALIVVDGGVWNIATGGAFLSDGAGSVAAGTLRYRLYGVVGQMQGGASPVNPVLQKSAIWP